MRAILGLCFVLLAALPVFAITVPANPTTDAEQAERSCAGEQTAKTGEDAKGKIDCSLKCGSRVMKVEKGKVVITKDEKGKQCSDLQKNVICKTLPNSPDCCTGTIRFVSPDIRTPDRVFSRCSRDDKEIEKQAELFENLAGRQQTATNLNDLIQSVDPDLPLPEGIHQELKNGLMELGFTPGQADELIPKLVGNQQSAEDALDKIATGRAGSITADEHGFSLSDAERSNLQAHMEALQPGERPLDEEQTDPAVARCNAGEECPDNTFKDDEKDALLHQAALKDDVADMCGKLDGCSVECSARNPLVCVTQNPGAVVCSPIARRFGCSTCDPNNNTAICPSMEAGIALQAVLLRENGRYFGSGQKSILQAFCSGYSASNCGPYAQFVASRTSIPINQTIDPNNTEQLARIMMASSRFESGRGVLYSPEQLQHGLEIAYGTRELPPATPGYVPNFTAGGLPNATSPFNIGYGNDPFSTGFGSPFGTGTNVGTPTNVGYPTNTGYPAQSGYGSGGIPGGTGPSQIPVSPIPISQIIDPQGQMMTVVSMQPVITLIAEPNEIVRGKGAIVSWSAVGVKTEPKCSITKSGVAGSGTFAGGNDGAKRLKTTKQMSPGVVTLTMKCVSSATGQVLEKGQQITVR
ncbi:MAG: hypothetical protein G01um10148_789 [Parcubacteria group bacterium Gr01-1014_8]|nr:MAG: hypothetical protein G01um10148_789 [Parcubacteria group bacterium Gr01-1014_8]